MADAEAPANTPQVSMGTGVGSALPVAHPDRKVYAYYDGG
jgi:hypothetical protein